VHALVAAMNEALGNVGSTVNFVEPLTADAQSGPAGLRALADEMNAGKVDTLVITAWNPVYAAPGDIDLAAALAKVPTTIYWTLHVDETADVVAAVLPAAHGLESWGDVRGLDGTVSIVQPLIDPLWTPITAADVLSIFLGQGDVGTYALLQAFWRRKAAADGLVDAMGFEAHWEHWLATGIVPKTAAAPVAKPALDAGAAAALRAAAPAAGQGTEVALVFDAKMGDGRHANSAWLQELPHPVTKMTWDNAITLSTSTAGELGLKKGDIATLSTADGRSVTGPVFVQPGQADDSITVALGYGRRRGGKVAVGVGFDAAALRTTTSPWFVRGVRLEKARGKHLFGITQDHGRMEGRDLALATTLAEVSQADSAFFKKVNNLRGPLPQIIEPVDYSQEAYKWGMSIDLSRCTGCGACAAACQSENNIAVVGRDNVRKGREMNWIRVDRYYEGSEADPTVVVQPIPCQHCETAPCEYVCPVNATVHSDEGLNEMVYNRCIGTRYCSNNCPYKVRRFNFLDFHGDVSPVRKMVHNPDVTVRSRGVMEKCTYCVQRIERVRIDARVEGRGIADGEVVTACQQTCPAGAISFGSLNDPGSKVSQKHADPRRYDLLHEINTRPRTVYLARVRNPNPELV
jgi:molybdopterin-containing oxidoreductase family iron-sulfur binding subunit